MTLDELISYFPDGKHTARGEYDTRCPGHDDRKASLGIRIGEKGGIVMKCQAGCANHDVLAAVGLTLRDLAPPGQNGSGPQFRASYRYDDANGNPVATKHRKPDKSFIWQNAAGGWTTRGITLPLFGLPELLKSQPGDLICIAEGEKDVMNLRERGLFATCNPHGAAKGNTPKWTQSDTDWLQQHLPDREFLIFADNDEAGTQHAEAIFHSLQHAGLKARFADLQGLMPSEDISDWLPRHTQAEFEALLLPPKGEVTRIVSNGVTQNGSGPSPLNSLSSSISFTAESSVDLDWPADLLPEAFHGTAGEIVHAIAPQSEADPAALLLNLLVTFGNMVGRDPHTQVLSTRHGANLFAALVGSTGEGSKGSSWDPTYELFEQVDSLYAAQHIVGGLASGEGLISLVRDRVEKRVQLKDKRTGRMTMEFDTVIEDEGVTDKRRLVLESEMSSLLKIMARPGNVLSEQLRMAWEKGNLQTVSKGSPAKATGAHVSLLGHITPDALRQHLTQADAANGFGNRFLWMLVRRSQYLPEGGVLPYLHTYIHNIQELIQQASVIGRVDREANSRRMWAAVYEDLRRPGVGMFGELTARRAPIVARLALIYALLDGVRVILPDHLLAALAVWQRSEASVRFLFGDATGDPMADALYDAMANRPEGAHRTDLHAALGRNRPVADLDRALTALQRAGRAVMRRQKGDGGREGEVWFALPVSKTSAVGVNYVAKAKAAYELHESNENRGD